MIAIKCTLFSELDPYDFGTFSRSYFTMFQVVYIISVVRCNNSYKI